MLSGFSLWPLFSSVFRNPKLVFAHFDFLLESPDLLKNFIHIIHAQVHDRCGLHRLWTDQSAAVECCFNPRFLMLLLLFWCVKCMPRCENCYLPHVACMFESINLCVRVCVVTVVLPMCAYFEVW